MGFSDMIFYIRFNFFTWLISDLLIGQFLFCYLFDFDVSEVVWMKGLEGALNNLLSSH